MHDDTITKRPGWPDTRSVGLLDRTPRWLLYALLLALVVGIIVAMFVFLGRQPTCIFCGVHSILPTPTP